VRASDGSAQSAPVTITVAVGGANDAPVAADDNFITASARDAAGNSEVVTRVVLISSAAGS
jgi:VCBS repeat-containing protein